MPPLIMGQILSSPIDNSPNAPSGSESQIVTHTDSVLPIELERLIFELAFDADEPAINTKLILVSKRVYSWLKPIIYRTFIQILIKAPYPDFSKISQNADNDLRDICAHAQYIIMDRSRHKHSEVLELLERCQNLVDVLCWRDIQLRFVWSAISKLKHLRRLSGNFYAMSSDHLRTAAWTRELTHLVLISYYGEQWRLKLDKDLLDALPSLTHLGLFGVDDINIKVLGELVKECGWLKVLLYFTPEDEVAADEIDLPGVASVYEKEERMVVFNVEVYNPDAWIAGTRGKPDVWRWAEGVVFARRNGYFKSEAYLQNSITQGFPWREHLTEKGLEWFEANAHMLQIGVDKDSNQ
ncbi:hypothetical protein BJ165DRAFT_5788 [Panaeolus papilionaceus]|nr:hypothetical protein BJ165DRAFT_5788 [Panaeolus papilionaceus]